MTARPAADRSALFSPAVAIAVVCVGIFAFSCLVVIFAYAPDLRGGSDPKAHALSRSAIGYAGLVALLRNMDAPVSVARTGSAKEVKERGLEILTPDLRADAKEVRAALFENRNLIILPKWSAAPDPLHVGWVKKTGLIDEADYRDSYLKGLVGPVQVRRRKGVARPVLSAAGNAAFAVAAGQVGDIDQLQTIASPKVVPLVVDEAGGVVLGRVDLGGNGVYILAEPDLANTHGLRDIRAARFAVAGIEAMGKGPIVFDVTLNGYKRERSLLRLAFEPPFLAATLCAVFAALLMGLHAAFRFGPARQGGRAIALGKQALADNSAALITLARREARMATPYAALTRQAVARAIGAPPDLDTEQLNAFLQRVGETRHVTTGLKELLDQTLAVRTPAELVRVARALFKWKLEMTRESS